MIHQINSYKLSKTKVPIESVSRTYIEPNNLKDTKLHVYQTQ